MALETETPDALDDDLFSAGFDEGLGEPGVEDQPVDETPAESIPPKQEETPADPTPEPVDVKALIAEAVAAAKAPVEEPAAPAAPALSKEEIEAEEQYRKDWPEHAAREDKLRTQLDEMKSLLAETTKVLQAQLAPVLEVANQTAEEKHYNTILSAHPDAQEIIGDVQKWISNQPKFLQPQYDNVLKQGSAQDVVELFTVYKGSTGVKDQDPPPKQETDNRLKRMAAPQSVRTSVTAEEDPDDFDGAFEAAVKKIK